LATASGAFGLVYLVYENVNGKDDTDDSGQNPGTDDDNAHDDPASFFIALAIFLCALAMGCKGLSKICCGAERLAAYEKQEKEKKLAAEAALREPLTATPVIDASIV
jgi:hypothetical protein